MKKITQFITLFIFLFSSHFHCFACGNDFFTLSTENSWGLNYSDFGLREYMVFSISFLIYVLILTSIIRIRNIQLSKSDIIFFIGSILFAALGLLLILNGGGGFFAFFLLVFGLYYFIMQYLWTLRYINSEKSKLEAKKGKIVEYLFIGALLALVVSFVTLMVIAKVKIFQFETISLILRIIILVSVVTTIVLPLFHTDKGKELIFAFFTIYMIIAQITLFI